MDAFASTGLVSLLLAVMRERDPALVAGLSRPDPMRGATQPEAVKRDLVAAIMARHGAGALLSVGAQLRRADEMPVAAVLLRSPDPGVLAGKWMRLERYHHAHHRVRIEADGSGWRCTRESAGAPPTVGENCLIAGLLLGLLEGIGCRGCRLVLGGREIAAPDLPGVVLPEGERVERFGLRWSKAGAAPRAAPEEGRPLEDRLTDLMAADMGRGWRIGDAARALGMSPRSLQRRLAEAERSFSGVLRRARMREATRMLIAGGPSLAEIGYCCGYADQAHFQRDFLRATNTTPGTFRRIAG